MHFQAYEFPRRRGHTCAAQCQAAQRQVRPQSRRPPFTFHTLHTSSASQPARRAQQRQPLPSRAVRRAGRVVRVLTPPTPHTRLLGMSQTTKKDMKYVLVTGGVVSGLGKGVTASSVGVLLKKAGQRCTSIKIGA